MQEDNAAAAMEKSRLDFGVYFENIPEKMPNGILNTIAFSSRNSARRH